MKIIATIKNKLSDLTITFKMAVFYIAILIISISICSILYQQIYYRLTSNKVGDVSMQILYSIKTNIEQNIDNLNNYSKMTLANDDLQNILRNGEIYSDLVTQDRLRQFLVKLMQAVPQIASVYIFDNYGNKYSVGNLGINQFTLNKIEEASWYDEALRNNGAYILRLNGEGAFEKDPDKNFVSMIRVVRDIESIKPIGILVINVRESAFEGSYNSIVNNYKTDITLLNENNESIVKSSNASKYSFNDYINSNGMKEYGSRIERKNGSEFILSYLKDSRFNWKIVSVMPFGELSSESKTFSFIGLIVILVNSFLLFIGSIFISRMITIPIRKLLKSMKGIELGEFKKVDIKAGKNEIGQLRDGYNIMIYEIQKLIKRVIEEQKVKRKAELNVLQAQIKPHFLYNTLDSINSLAISGKTEEVSEIIEALGNYYRVSLSKGKEVITLEEEIEGVRNYLTIQKIRYGNMFSASFDVDERVLNHKILKLVIQPLVENALYHGIRAKGESGTIKVSAKYCNSDIYLVIEDDGVGMSEEFLNKLLDINVDLNSKSFGFRGTIERLRIFYGIENICKIESKIGLGTKVTIKIPKVEENEHGNQ